MTLKKKLGLGLASAALGLSLIGGGTYAYFNDFTETTSKFTNGTLDLNASPTTIIDVNNLKPGDTMLRSFQLKNDGSLDIASILLRTSYTVTNKAGAPANTEDLGKHIRVNFLSNADKGDNVFWSTTIDQLATMTPDAIENSVFDPLLEEIGGKLAAGTADTFNVQFEFVENGLDQNQFQGDSLELKWTFEGKQGPGVAR